MTTRGAFSGKVALVTGGASGIGLACVRRLAAGGAKVAVADFDEKGIRRLAKSLEAADLHHCDVSDAEAVRRVVADVVARRKKIDLVVVAAGICRDGVLWKMTDDAWSRVIGVNLSGAGNVIRAVAPSMRDRKAGRIVLISSINGRRGKFGQSNYAASKAGLVGLARSAARELGSSGVTVNVVEPGFTETPMTAGLSNEVRAKAIADTPLGKTASAADIAAAVAFFLGPDGSHVTGQVLAVDGGQGMGA